MRKCIMALGTFDGVHRGHAALLDRAVCLSQQLNMEVAAFTFAEHPQQVLTGKKVGLLCTLSERISLLRLAGAQMVVAEHFDEVSHLAPTEFLEYLYQKYNVRALVCGKDFRFGKGAAGDTALLSKWCKEKGLPLSVVDFVCDKAGQKISSRRIRLDIAEGNMAAVTQAMGRAFSVQGEVRRGKGLAHLWNTPTINLSLPQSLIFPRFGVYESRVEIEGKYYRGITNVGIRPTFDDGQTPNVETFILEGRFDDIKEAKVELIRFLRDEIKFDDPQALIHQIQKDIQQIQK